MSTEQYRDDQYDSVYKFDEEADAYLFIGKKNGRTLEEFIIEYEEGTM